MNHKSSAEVASLVRTHIEALESECLRSELLQSLITLFREPRTFQSSYGEAQGYIWLFFTITNCGVALAYSDDDYGELGLHWGLVNIQSTDYGSSGAWYSSLEDLVEDSGYFHS